MIMTMIFPALVLLLGVFIGLVLGAFMARQDLRAAAAATQASGPSDPSDAAASEVDGPAPTDAEGR